MIGHVTLPPGQLFAAPSPTGPDKEQDLLALEVIEPNGATIQIGQRDIGH